MKVYNLNDLLSLPVKMSEWPTAQPDPSLPPKGEEQQEVRILIRFSGGLLNFSPVMF
jgi:hypothetical protein